MALNFNNEYSPRTNPPDGSYPYGSAKNVVIPNDDTGTPLEKGWLNDVLGMLQSLMVEANITPSGDADTVVDSDYRDSLRAMCGGVFETRDGSGVRALADTSTVKLDQFVVTIGQTGIGDGLGAFYRIVASGTGTPGTGEFINLPNAGLQAQRIEMQKWRNDEIVASLQSYADSGDSSTLSSAQSYADSGDSSTLSSAQSYADSGDSSTLSSANSYTDAAVADLAPRGKKVATGLSGDSYTMTGLPNEATFEIEMTVDEGGSTCRLVFGIGRTGTVDGHPTFMHARRVSGSGTANAQAVVTPLVGDVGVATDGRMEWDYADVSGETSSSVLARLTSGQIQFQVNSTDSEDIRSVEVRWVNHLA